MTKALRSNHRSTRRIRRITWWSQGHGLYEHDVLKGVLDYIQEHPTWTLQQILCDLPDREWRAWKGDGILACHLPPNCAKSMRALLKRRPPIPMVDISANRLFPSLSWVESDNTAVGALAAEHLLERGLKHFGYCGFSGYPFSDQRRDAFVLRLQQAGFPCTDYTVSGPVDVPQMAAIAHWLVKLPKPVGILGALPTRGHEILEACRRRKLAVPEDVAVITVNQGGEFGLLENPPLSYVKLNTRQIGYESAALLDRLMSGHTEPPGTAHLIAPLGVEPRQSTDMLAIPDRYVTAALRYIWQHACEGIQVKDLLQIAPISRFAFERRFEKFVGRTPHEEIERVQMNQVKTLLTGTKLSLAEIAERTGFAHVQYLAGKFHQLTGMTPGKYRTQQR